MFVWQKKRAPGRMWLQELTVGYTNHRSKMDQQMDSWIKQGPSGLGFRSNGFIAGRLVYWMVLNYSKSSSKLSKSRNGLAIVLNGLESGPNRLNSLSIGHFYHIEYSKLSTKHQILTDRILSYLHKTDRIFHGPGKTTSRTYVKCFKKVGIDSHK